MVKSSSPSATRGSAAAVHAASIVRTSCTTSGSRCAATSHSAITRSSCVWYGGAFAVRGAWSRVGQGAGVPGCGASPTRCLGRACRQGTGAARAPAAPSGCGWSGPRPPHHGREDRSDLGLHALLDRRQIRVRMACGPLGQVRRGLLQRGVQSRREGVHAFGEHPFSRDRCGSVPWRFCFSLQTTPSLPFPRQSLPRPPPPRAVQLLVTPEALRHLDGMPSWSII